jgi:hypothetical protein
MKELQGVQEMQEVQEVRSNSVRATIMQTRGLAFSR